eukprot:c16463_g1_i1.p1 GENE.c16463_g1_i1~~c16463_g1_i1.p1  ORF type:complete len:510 (-),score=206.10 c16463_g1_i1:65-1561(-)
MANETVSTTTGLVASRQEQIGVITNKEEIEFSFQTLRESFQTKKSFDVKWRIAQLKLFERMLTENVKEITDALTLDLGKPEFEGLLCELAPLLDGLRYTKKRVKSWSKAKSVGGPWVMIPSSSKVLKEPKGVALIIGAWNFPFVVSFGPMIDAIAAGCACILKPSEIAPNSAKCMANLVGKYLDPNFYRVVLGGIPETTTLLSLPFDHIFYTGNGAIGKIVMKAAAENLSTVSLELGGKSPAIVEKDANLAVAARRILFGKSTNCGQICLAPDYILCHADVQKEFTDIFLKTLKEMHGEEIEKSVSYGRIINVLHYDRISNLISTSGGTIICGGLTNANRENKFIPLTLITNPDPSSPIMKQEIFGPVAFILPFSTTDEAIKIMNKQDIPLALYVFSQSNKKISYIIKNVRSGGVCVNDCVVHNANPELPFGGLGSSGQGKYHGRHGFEEFTHSRAVMYRPTWIDPPFRYAPYTNKITNLIKKVLIQPKSSKVTTKIN